MPGVIRSSAGSWMRPMEQAVRAELSAHFDVLVVVWVLALAVGWSCYAVSHTQLTTSQWSSAPHSGPAWVYPDPNGN